MSKTQNVLLAAGISLAMVFTFASCSSDNNDGKDENSSGGGTQQNDPPQTGGGCKLTFPEGILCLVLDMSETEAKEDCEIDSHPWTWVDKCPTGSALKCPNLACCNNAGDAYYTGDIYYYGDAFKSCEQLYEADEKE